MLSILRNLWKQLVRKEEGQGMVEYGLIIALVAIAAIVALQLMGTNILAIFTDVQETLANAL